MTVRDYLDGSAEGKRLHLLELPTTRKGEPVYWEQGGGRGLTGEAHLVAGPKGESLLPICNAAKRFPNGRHIPFIARPGQHIIIAQHHLEVFSIWVYRMLDVAQHDGRWHALLECPYIFRNGEWTEVPPAGVLYAVEQAKRKALCQNCRHPHYCACG